MEAKFEKEPDKVRAISQERTSTQKLFKLDKVVAIVIIINKRLEQPIHRSFVRSVIRNHHPYDTTKSIRFLNQAIPKPALKYQIRIKMHYRSKEKKDWMIEFLSRSDMTYTNPGRQVNVYNVTFTKWTVSGSICPDNICCGH